MDPADSRREENIEQPEKSLEQSLLTRPDGTFSTTGLKRYPKQSYTSDSEALSTKDTKAIIQRVSNRIDKPVVWEPSIGTLSPEMVFRFSKDVLDRYPNMAGKYSVETPETEEGAGDELPLAQSTGTAPHLPRRRRGSTGTEPEMPAVIPASERLSTDGEIEQQKPERVIHAPAPVQRKPGVRPVSRTVEVDPAIRTRENPEPIEMPGLSPELPLRTAEQNVEKIVRKTVPEIRHEEQPFKEVVQRKDESLQTKTKEIPLEEIPSDRPKNLKIDSSQVQTFEPRRPRPAPQKPLETSGQTVESLPIQRIASETKLPESSTHQIKAEKQIPSQVDPVLQSREEPLQKPGEEKEHPSPAASINEIYEVQRQEPVNDKGLPSGAPLPALPDVQRDIDEAVHGKEVHTDTIPATPSSVQFETKGTPSGENGVSESSRPSFPVIQGEVEGLSSGMAAPPEPQAEPPAAFLSDVRHDVNRTIQKMNLDPDLEPTSIGNQEEIRETVNKKEPPPSIEPEKSLSREKLSVEESDEGLGDKGTAPQLIQRDSKPAERKTQLQSASDYPPVPESRVIGEDMHAKAQRRGEETPHESQRQPEAGVPLMEKSLAPQAEPPIQRAEAAESSQRETPEVVGDLPEDIQQLSQEKQQEQILRSENEYPELTMRPGSDKQIGEDAPALPQPAEGLESLAKSIYRKFDLDFGGKDQESAPSSKKSEKSLTGIQSLPDEPSAGEEEHTRFSVKPDETSRSNDRSDSASLSSIGIPLQRSIDQRPVNQQPAEDTSYPGMPANPLHDEVQKAANPEARVHGQSILQQKQEDTEPLIKKKVVEGRPTPVEETSQIANVQRLQKKRTDLTDSAASQAYLAGNQAYQTDDQNYNPEQNSQTSYDVGYAQKEESKKNDILRPLPGVIEDTKEIIRSEPVGLAKDEDLDEKDSVREETKGDLTQKSLVQRVRIEPSQELSVEEIETEGQEQKEHAQQHRQIRRETIDDLQDSQPAQKEPDGTILDERGKEKETRLPLRPEIQRKSQDKVLPGPRDELSASRLTKEGQQEPADETKHSTKLPLKDTVQRQTGESGKQLDTSYQEFPAKEPGILEGVEPYPDQSRTAAPGAMKSSAASLDPVRPIKHIQRKVGLADEVYKRDEIRRRLPLSSPDIGGYQDMEQSANLSMLTNSGTVDFEDNVETDSSDFQYHSDSQRAAQILPYKKASPSIQRAQFPRAELPLQSNNVSVQSGSAASSTPGIDHLISAPEPNHAVESVQRLPLALPLKIEPRTVHEVSIQRAAETEESIQTTAQEAEEPELDLNDLARKVYPLIKRLLAIERERFTGR